VNVDEPQTVGADEPHAVRPRVLQHLCFQCAPVFATFAETAAELGLREGDWAWIMSLAVRVTVKP